MSKKIKRKVIVSVVSLIIIFVLSMMISGYFEIINKWIPIIEDGYIIIAVPILFAFFLISSSGSMKNYLKTDWHSQSQV